MWPFLQQREKNVVIQHILRQVEKALWDFEQQGADLSQLRLKKYQKTHFVACVCAQCKAADKRGDAQGRGMLESGYKLYVPSKDTPEENT